MEQIVHIATVEYMTEVTHYADSTEEGLYRQLAAYCRDHWGTCNKNHIETPPEDDRRCVDLYFEDHENDSFTTGVCTIPRTGVPDRAEFVKAAHVRQFRDSLDRAIAHAGGGGSHSWDGLKKMTLEELGEILAPNGIEFVYIGKEKNENTHLNAVEAWELLVRIQPHL